MQGLKGMVVLEGIENGSETRDGGTDSWCYH
jgi:hypothetical protein